MKKIGILSGTFDPVHAGHVAFAKQAIEEFHLTKVVFLPERQPRRKNSVTKMNDRLKMLQLAINHRENFEIYDTHEPYFTLIKSLPKLRSRYPNSFFVFLVGSDVARTLPEWESISDFSEDSPCKFLVAIRSGHDEEEIKNEVGRKVLNLELSFMLTPHSAISSRQIREGKDKTGIETVDNYIAEHHLYS